jgi:acyl-CoA synthetase (AMP-forming)/AMP-acid ligase II
MSIPSGPVVPPLTGAHQVVADAMDAASAQHGGRGAYVDGDRRLSFAEWVHAADVLAARLVDDGVRPGDVVVMQLPSTIEYAIAYAAILRAGAVATGINSRLGPREVDAILERAAPARVLDDPAAVAATIGSDGPVLGSRRPHRRPDDPAVIIWTSGTTGTPKGAWFDHRNLAAAVTSAGVMSAPYDRKLTGTPFPHAGYMSKLWDQLAWGATMVVSPTPWHVDDMLRLLVDEQITVAGGVPTQWAKLVEHPGLDGVEVPHLRLCVAATAPAPPELVARVSSALGSPMVVRYAMTESPSITGTEPDDDPEVMFRTVGRPQPGMEVVVDAPAGEVGRVRVRGACVMRGYWGAPELTAEVLASDGWLTSSDLGRFDADGNLVLVGRADDMYLRGGYNVYPLEVEHVLSEHPGSRRWRWSVCRPR